MFSSGPNWAGDMLHSSTNNAGIYQVDCNTGTFILLSGKALYQILLKLEHAKLSLKLSTALFPTSHLNFRAIWSIYCCFQISFDLVVRCLIVQRIKWHVLAIPSVNFCQSMRENVIQSSAVITRSNLSLCYIRHWDNSGRTYIRFETHNRHAISVRISGRKLAAS